MGTDIHGVFQRHDAATNTWHDVESTYGQDRHYQLFAVLAGVRNGYGFAGVPTGEPVTPIAPQRGYPADFALVQMEEDDDGNQRVIGPARSGSYDDYHPIATLDHMDPRRRKWHEQDKALVVWMGEHSHSWLTGAEMLTWWAKAPTVTKVGILSRPTYEAWDKQSEPPSYSGGVSGPDVVIVDDDKVSMEKTPDWTYVRCHWESKLADELKDFVDEVQRLGDEHGAIRFVFGFDS